MSLNNNNNNNWESTLELSMLFVPELLLQPAISTNINTTEHLKIAFIRANEELLFDGEDVGGRRLYGGAILSKNANNNNKWMKVKYNRRY